MDDLPTEYDVIVAGTGMTESILAAALSRIGKQVLHLDTNEYYGENWGSFNIDGIRSWVDSHMSELDKPIIDTDSFVHEGESKVIPCHVSHIINLEEKWEVKEDKDPEKLSTENVTKFTEDNEKETESVKEKLTQKEILQQSRLFNIDLCPKVLFSRGPLVELLISSNIARYAEFKSVTQVLTWLDGCLLSVPCSRADVFATRDVSVFQKRMLVKVLTSFTEYPENSNEFNGFEEKTFLEYLKQKKLPDNLIHYIQHAIGMVRDSTPCMEGVSSCKTFLQSLGRYGNTPFIFPLYGCGEMPQCFCRLCAVFGGIYHLKRGIDCLLVKDGQCTGIVSGGQRLQAKFVILSSSSAPKEYLEEDSHSSTIKRAVYITDGSILPAEKGQPITLLRFPPTPPSSQSATVIELDSSTHTTPPGCFLVHVTAPSAYPLEYITDSLFKQPKSPAVLYSLSWEFKEPGLQTANLPTNLRICSGPDLGLDYDFPIMQAKNIFKEFCPDEEFLPRAPDPDEIVLEGLEETSNVNQNEQDANKTNSTECEEKEADVNAVREIEKIEKDTAIDKPSADGEEAAIVMKSADVVEAAIDMKSADGVEAAIDRQNADGVEAAIDRQNADEMDAAGSGEST